MSMVIWDEKYVQNHLTPRQLMYASIDLLFLRDNLRLYLALLTKEFYYKVRML